MGRRRAALGVVLGTVVTALAAAGAWWLGGVLATPRAAPPAVAAPVPIAAGTPASRRELHTPLSASNASDVALALVADGRRVVTAGVYGAVTVTDTVTGRATRLAPGASVGALSVAQARRADADVATGPDGRSVWTTTALDGTLRRLDLDTGRVTAAVALPGGAGPAAVAPDGRRVYVAGVGGTGTVAAVDGATGAVVASWPAGPAPVRDLAVSPDGRRLVALGDEPGGATLIDTATGRVVAVTPLSVPREPQATAVAMSPDATRAWIVTGPHLGPAAPDADTAGGVTAVDTRTGAVVDEVHAPGTLAVASSPDGRLLHLGRGVDVLGAPGTAAESTPVVETRETAAPHRVLGALTDTAWGNGPALSLLAGPSGRGLYADEGLGPVVIALR